MSTYLLLRDNKQSGPYSLSEIQTKGFKKYDLVWVEGKSAAWRYPGEVAELKPFAPIVEEQPFDRFFKKPSEQNKEATTSRQEPVKKEIEKAAVATNQIVAEMGDKKVYAALPAKKNPNNSQPQIILIKPSIKEEIKKPIPEPVVNNYFEEKEPVAVHEQNINQPKEKYFSKKNDNDNRRYFQPVALAACVLALLGAGIFIGMSISKSPSSNIPKEANEKQIAKIDKPGQTVSMPISTSVPVEEKTNVAAKESENLNNSENPISGSKPIDPDRKNADPNDKKKSSRPKPSNSVAELPKIIPQREDISDSNSSGAQAIRQSTHRTGAINDKELIKTNIENLVSVSSNKYNVGTFGGISEVQLTVNNKSVYPLDLVMVEVQYVQANKKVFKTENIYYRNLRPGGSMMQEAPKSSRGVKIQYKVTLINSKESSVSYSGI